MADKDKIIISAELQALTEKQVNKFAAQMVKSITNALKSVSIDISKVQIVNMDKLATKAANQFGPAFNKALADVTVNANKLKKFQVPVKLDLTGAKAQLAQFAKENTLTVVTNVAQPASSRAGTTVASPGGAALPTDILTEGAVQRATAALQAHRTALRAAGLETSEIDKETNEYSTTLRRLQSQLDNMRRVAEVKGQLDEKEITRSRIRRREAEDLIQTLRKLGTAQAISNTETRRGEAFMDSFGFRVGIVGFGLGILGGHLQRFSQFMVQAIQTGAQLIEPLERIRNLLFQDPSISEGERTGILAELRRLADFPGASLETTAKTFRSLQTLGLATADTLLLLEGLTKATARSGIGAEGLDRIAAQLRDFASTGQLKQQEIRSIISAGGRDIANIFANSFGGTDAASVNKFGPDVVIKTIIAELEKLPEPIATVTDRLNRLKNVVVDIALAIAPLVSPGLDSLLSILQHLTPAVVKLTKAFESLPEGLRDVVSLFIVLTPAIAAVTAVVLTLGAALLIFLASFNHMRRGLRDVRGLLLGTTKEVGYLTGTVKAAGTQLTILGAIGAKVSAGLTRAFAPVVTMFKNLRGVMAAAANPVGFATGIGAGSKLAVNLSTLAFVLKGGGAAILTPLKGILSILPRILGFTGPIGILINLLLALATNAGHARDVVGAALTGLGESLDRLFTRLGTTGTDVLNTIFNILGAIVTLVGGALGAALSGIITQITAIIDAMDALVALIQDPSWENLGNFIYEALSSLIEGLSVFGGLLAAAILDALAEAFKDTRLGRLLGTDALSDAAETIRKNISAAYNTAPIDKATKSTNTLTSATIDLNDELTEAGKLIDSLEKSLNKLSISYSRMIADLQTKQLKFNLGLQSDQAEFEFDQEALRDPEKALRDLPQLLETQTQNALTGIRTTAKQEVQAIAEDLDRVLKTLTSGLFGPQSTLAAFMGTDFVNAFFDLTESLKEVNRLAAAGDITLESYEKRLAEIKDAGDSLLKSILGANMENDLLTRTGPVNAGRARAQAENFNKLVGETLDITNKLGKAIGDQAEEQQRVTNEAIKTRAQKERELKERIEAIKLETSLQGRQLVLQRLQTQMAQEEERVRELASRGEETSLAAVFELRKKIADEETRIATMQNRRQDGQIKDALVEQQIINAKILRDDENKSKEAQDRLNLLKEQSKVQEDLFRQSIDTLRNYFDEARQRAVDLSTAPGLGEDFLKRVEYRIKELADLQLLLSTEVRDAEQRLRPDDLVRRTGVTTATGDRPSDIQAIDIFRGQGIDSLKTTLLSLAEASARTEVNLNRAKEQLLAMERAGDNTSVTYKEQVALVQDLAAGSASEARVIEFINALLKQKTKVLDDAIQKQIRATEAARAEAQWRQEILEIELENIQLQAASARQRAGRGDLGLGGVLSGIQSRREQAEKKEIELIKQKYVLLKNELEIRRLNLEAQMRLSGSTQEDIDAMNELFNKRKELLEENEKLDTTVTEDANKLDPFTQKLNDMAQAFRDLYGAAREARQSLSEFFNEAASGEIALDVLYKALTEGAKLTDVVSAAFFTMTTAISQALIQSLRDGENFLETLGSILGNILIKLGQMLIEMAAVSVAMAFAGGLARSGGNIWVALADAAAALPWAILMGAAGAGLIVAGTAMGGGGGGGRAASQNTANAADSTTGAQRNTFEPNKDPRFIFQKTMLATIQLEIKTDDSQIIKAVINGVNQNGRLTRLIGNRKLAWTV